MKQAVGFQRRDRLMKCQPLMEPMPFAGVPMPHEVVKARADPVEPRERRIELLAQVVRIAGPIALEKCVRRSAPSADDVDRVVELCGTYIRQKARP